MQVPEELDEEQQWHLRVEYSYGALHQAVVLFQQEGLQQLRRLGHGESGGRRGTGLELEVEQEGLDGLPGVSGLGLEGIEQDH